MIPFNFSSRLSVLLNLCGAKNSGQRFSIKNLPSTQEEQLTFLLGKYPASDIKTAFADAIGKVGKAARKALYPLPLREEKLVSKFLELIYDGKSIMVDNLNNSFR